MIDFSGGQEVRTCACNLHISRVYACKWRTTGSKAHIFIIFVGFYFWQVVLFVTNPQKFID